MTAQILEGLIAVNLAAAGAIVVMLIAGRPIRRLFGARIAYAAWAVVPLAAAASLLPARGIEALPSAPLRPIAEATVLFLAEPAKSAPVDWATLAVACWALGALALILLTIWTQRRTLGLIGRLTPEGRLVRSANPAVGPATLGVLKPRIMVPADFEERFDAAERAVIIAHEEAHLAGGDVRINAAIELARCLLWFNPLVHLAARQVRVAQELACDAAVIARFPGRRRTYAGALLKTQAAAAALPLGCYWPAHPLKERLTMLTLKAPGRARSVCGAAFVGALSLGAGYAAWAAAPVAAEPAAILQPVIAAVAAAQPVLEPAPAPVRPRPQQTAPALSNSEPAAVPDRALQTFQIRRVGPVNVTADQMLTGDRFVILRGDNASISAMNADGRPASISEIAQAEGTVIIRCDKTADGVSACVDSEGQAVNSGALGPFLAAQANTARRVVIIRRLERRPAE